MQQESPGQGQSHPPAVETPSPWRASLGGMSRSLSRFTEDAARELERTTQEAREALARQTAAAQEAYRESLGREGGLGAALDRTSSSVAALTAKASEAAAAALAAASEIEVTFTEPGPLGISFGSVGKTEGETGIPKVVIEIEPGGAASRMEPCPIERRMELTKVQGYSCEQLSFGATLDLIRAGSRPLTLTFKRPHIFDKGPGWVDDINWDAAKVVCKPDEVSLPPHEPEPEPEPLAPPEPAPQIEGVTVGMRVCVRPEVEAEAACVDAGVKWNPARRSRAAGLSGEVSEVCDDGGVKVRWVEEKEGGRTDTTNLKFPVAALQDAGWSPAPAAATDQDDAASEDGERESAGDGSSGNTGSSAAAAIPTDSAASKPVGLPVQVQQDGSAGVAAPAFSSEVPAVDASVEVAAAPPPPPAVMADSPAVAEVADERDQSVEPSSVEWGLADAEAVLAAEHPTAADCQRAADLFADIIETSPGDAAAKAGLRSALAAKRKAKRAGR